MDSPSVIDYSVHEEFQAVSGGVERIATFIASGKKFTDRPYFRAKDENGAADVQKIVLGGVLASMGWIPPSNIMMFGASLHMPLEIVAMDHSLEPQYVARHITPYDFVETVQMAAQYAEHGVYPSPCSNAPPIPIRKHIERLETAQAFLVAVQKQGGLVHVPMEEPKTLVGKWLRHLSMT